MTSLATDLKAFIAKRVADASPAEVINIVGTLCAEPQPVVQPRAINSQWQVFDEDIAFDPVTGLYMTRDYVPGGQRNWLASIEAASKLDLRGWKWRAPTIQEQLLMVDYDRCDPAFNTDVFRGDESWVWTSTPYKRSPSVCAWFVSFGSGDSGCLNRSSSGFVRAVRVSQ